LPAVATYQLDANILLRFLRNDHKEHSPRAARLIQHANDGKAVLRVSAVTVAEAFYALKVSYKVPRRTAAQLLATCLGSPAFRLSKSKRVLDSLGRVIAANVDFGDAYIAAMAAEAGIPVASFDRDLDKFVDVKRFEP
jgi:predicted nucleic acid-binding protein